MKFYSWRYPGNKIARSAIIHRGAVMGEGNTIGENVVIHKNVVLGSNNFIGDGTILGAPAEIKGNKEIVEGFVHIGDDNVIREYVCVHSPGRKAATVIGSRCYIMNKVHVGHDCQIGNDVIIAAMSSTGGVTVIKDFAYLGQAVTLRGRLTIGESAMIGCKTNILEDIPAFQTWVGNPARRLNWNVIGMERRGFTQEKIKAIVGSGRKKS